MDNYKVISTPFLEDLQKRASELIEDNYIPIGGITQVSHYDLFSYRHTNYLSTGDGRNNNKIQFLQAFYKPKSNLI